MPIIINGTTLGSSASINGISLNTIKFNGTTVWEAIPPEIEISLSSAMTVKANNGVSKYAPSQSTYTNLFSILSQPIDFSKFTYFQLHYIYTLRGNGDSSSRASINYNGTSILSRSQKSANPLSSKGYTEKKPINESRTCPIQLFVYGVSYNGSADITIDSIKFTND